MNRILFSAFCNSFFSLPDLNLISLHLTSRQKNICGGGVGGWGGGDRCQHMFPQTGPDFPPHFVLILAVFGRLAPVMNRLRPAVCASFFIWKNFFVKKKKLLFCWHRDKWWVRLEGHCRFFGLSSWGVTMGPWMWVKVWMWVWLGVGVDVGVTGCGCDCGCGYGCGCWWGEMMGLKKCQGSNPYRRECLLTSCFLHCIVENTRVFPSVYSRSANTVHIHVKGAIDRILDVFFLFVCLCRVFFPQIIEPHKPTKLNEMQPHSEHICN